MDAFAVAGPSDQAEVFSEVAARMGVATIIVEKDFWVCWTLKRLFEFDAPGDGFLFKGGTSLSKAYGLIERFSEDIDVSLDRKGLGFSGGDNPAEIAGKNARKRKIADLAAATGDHVQGSLLPRLNEAMEAKLGDRHFTLASDPDDPQTLLFTYPTFDASLQEAGYVLPVVRLEFGARADHEPVEDRPVSPYLVDHFPDLLDDPIIMVRTLSAVRTFREKATILHDLALRPAGKPLGDRMSRHHSDLARVIEAGTGDQALDVPDLLVAVANHKTVFFRTGGDPYASAKLGTLRLTPPGPLAKRLEVDYRAMTEMFFGDAPSWIEITDTIAAFERTANSER